MSKHVRAGLSLAASLVLAAGSLVVRAGPASAVSPGFDVSPTALAYGDLVVGGTTPLSVTLTNQDPGSHVIGTTTISGANLADFTITGDSCNGATVAASGSCVITVTFAPAASGSRAATLNIPTDDSTGTHTVDLGGNGVDGLQVATSVDIGSAPSGGPGITTPVPVANFGATSLGITGASIGGTNASDFAITGGDCVGATLGTSQSCAVQVTLTPSARGARAATLVLTGPLPFGTVSVGLTGTGTNPLSPVSWKTTYRAGPAYTWTYGGALSRTVQSGTQRLHLVYATDRVGGKWVKNSGPYQGVYYTRSTSGATWGTPKRLNPSTQHADRATTAAAGSRVYALWVSQTRYTSYLPTAPRVLYVRVNTSHGAATQWKTAIRLTGRTGRVDYPTIAATGPDAYIAYTDSKTGAIRLAISHNGGGTWATKTLGTTTYKANDGFEGVPYVAVSGSNVVVAWDSTQANAIRVRVSTNKGATWGAATELTSASDSIVSVAIRGTRVAVGWNDGSGVLVAVRSGGVWGAPRLVAGAVGMQYAPVVALQDPNRVGIAWAEDIGGTALKWAESPDNGVAWYAPQTVASTATATHTENDWASVLWPSAGTRIIAWNGYTTDYANYRQYIRTGTGTPGGIAALAPLRPSLSGSAGRVAAHHPADLRRRR